MQLFLSTVPLFAHLEAADRAKIAVLLEAVEVKPGLPIVNQGDTGDAMYFLERGAAQAEVSGKGTVMHYGAGDFFGELALMQNQPRMATVRAAGEVCLPPFHHSPRHAPPLLMWLTQRVCAQDGARCLKLVRESFDTIAEGCAAILDQRAKLYAQSGEGGGSDAPESEPEDSELDSEPEDSELDSEPEDSDLESEPEDSDMASGSDSEPEDPEMAES